MKKAIIILAMIMLMIPMATAFQPFSNYTYSGKYSDYVPTFVTSRVVLSDVGLAWGMNNTDNNFRVIIPYFITNPFTTEKVADNNTLFAVSVAFDETVNALSPCVANFTDTLNDQLWIIDRQGDNWVYDLNSSPSWSNQKSSIFFFEAENYDAEIDSYSELIDVLLTKETFCPTYKIWGFRKLSWTEVTIANEESRAGDIHSKATTIFDYAINIIILNYKLWLIAYWVIAILVVIGAVSLMFAIPFLFYRHLKRL